MEVVRKVSAGGINVGVMSTEGPLEVLEELVELLSTVFTLLQELLGLNLTLPLLTVVLNCSEHVSSPVKGRKQQYLPLRVIMGKKNELSNSS